MLFRTDNQGSSINTHLTQMQGTIQATLNELRQVFGEPATGEPGDRVIASYAIEFDDKTVASVYLYRHGDLPAPDEIHSWHIAGIVPRAVFLVHQAFREHFGLAGSLRKAA